MALEHDLQLAEDLLRSAGDVLLDLRHSELSPRQKRSQADIVTEVDLASERVMVELLQRRAPDAGLLSEECGFQPGRSGDVWVIDPLDGTANYASGREDFGVIAGLVRDGRPVVGGMFLPVSGELYLAGEGAGATRSGVPINVSTATRLADAIVDHSLANLDEVMAEQMRTLEALIRMSRGVRCVHSLHYLARTAEGVCDGFVYHSLGLWDICGPSVILIEAGGRLTDLRGKPLALAPDADSVNRVYGVVGANPQLLPELLAVTVPLL